MKTNKKSYKEKISANAFTVLMKKSRKGLKTRMT